MAKEELIQLELTDWEKQILFELLSKQETGKCSFGVMADMIALRNDLKEGNDVSVRREVFQQLYQIVMNPNLQIVISEDSLNMFNKFKDLRK